MNDYIPTEEEFEVILAALGYYEVRAKELIMNEEVLKATQRLSTRASKEVVDNAAVFEDAFNPKQKDPLMEFVNDLSREIDTKAIQSKATKAKEDLTLLSAKVIRLRDQYRMANTDKAIRSLLNP